MEKLSEIRGHDEIGDEIERMEDEFTSVNKSNKVGMSKLQGMFETHMKSQG